jgi:hypothetical protein
MVDSGCCDELGIQNYFVELADLVDGKVENSGFEP